MIDRKMGFLEGKRLWYGGYLKGGERRRYTTGVLGLTCLSGRVGTDVL